MPLLPPFYPMLLEIKYVVHCVVVTRKAERRGTLSQRATLYADLLPPVVLPPVGPISLSRATRTASAVAAAEPTAAVAAAVTTAALTAHPHHHPLSRPPPARRS